MPRFILRTLAVVYAIYLALVVLVVIPAANYFAPRLAGEYLHRELRSDAILFNPFTLAAEVRGVQLLEPGGRVFLGLDRATLNISLESLLGDGPVLDDLRVKGLYLDLRRLPDGSFNFSDLLPAEGAAAEEPAEPARLPPLTIHHLEFDARRIQLTDLARAEPFSTHYDDLDIHATGLTTTVRDSDPYRIDVEDESGGELVWEGTVSLEEERSAGSLVVTHLRLQPLWRFAKPWLNFTLGSGELGLQADYAVSWHDGFAAQVSGGEFKLVNLALAHSDTAQFPDTALSLGSLSLSGIGVDTAAHSAAVDEAVIDGLDVSGWMQDGRVSLAEMFALRGLDNTPADPNAAQPAGGEAAWSASLGELRLQNSALHWRSPYTDPGRLDITPVDLQVESLHWPPRGPSPLKLGLKVNGDTSLSLQGDFDPGAGAGDIAVHLDGLPLTWFNPDLPRELNGGITGGALELDGSVRLAGFLPQRLQLDGAITDFASVVRGEEDAITRWDSWRWRGLDVDIGERKVSLQQLRIDGHRGRLHIYKDGSVNTSRIFVKEYGGDTSGAKPAQPEAPPWQVDVAQILIADSALDFMDESIPLHFRTVVGELNGEIANISSAPGARTRVDINGSVGGYAPVHLAGSASPFDSPPALDLALDFRGVDLALLTPYSATYAGYAIERGLLNLKLHYTLRDARLAGDNKVLISRLKLGKKVDSDKAPDLPLKLALALLTDADGVIDLEVPVEGDVDDPQFALGKVIGGAFVNLLSKAVTAPFTLLANLVGSGEDLQRLEFPAGDSALTGEVEGKLAQLADALSRRPKLVLVVSGRVDADADGAQLRERRLLAQLRAAGLSEEDIQSRDDDFVAAVDARYAALGSAPDAEEDFAQRYARVLAAVPVSDEEFAELARERALAVKQYLVDTLGVAADRAVVQRDGGSPDAQAAFRGVELSIDT